MTRVTRLAALVVVALLVTGCGYSLRGNLPSHIKSVAVPLFRNRTNEPGVESFLTVAVVEAFSTNGRLRVVRPEQADSILDGEVIGYQVQSIAYDPQSNVQQYRLIVTLNIKFRDVRRDEVLYEQKNLQERSDFRFQGVVSQTISREETALRTAATEIARAIVALAIDRF
jgi:outer membrane lipopolysaccharide assembly protein LptE/RlpB